MKISHRISLMFLAVVLFFTLFFYNIGALLSATDIAKKADVVICLSGTTDRIDKAALLLLQNGLAEKVIVTTAEAHQQMLQKKVEPERLLAASWSAKTTYEEGLLLKTILNSEVRSALVVSDPFHLLRVKWTFRHIFCDDSISFSFISSDAPSLQGFWWSNPNSRLFVLNELPKIVYYWFWHGMLGIVEDPQWAKDLGRAYMAFVKGVFVP